MSRLTVLAALGAVLLACPAGAQELTNHALGRPYAVTPAPVERYADDSGPEAYAAAQPYRGELTDGVSGPADYHAAEWVGWRDTSYRDPIRVDIDLGEVVRVDRIEVTVCGAAGEVEPPEHIDVFVTGPQFPLPVPVQVARVTSRESFEPGEPRVYTFAVEDADLRAERVRLDLDEPTWSYLFVDEVRVLGGEPGEPGILPVHDVTIEAESADERAAATEIEGASGAAVVLDEPGETMQARMPLPAGDYTVRVRSLAVEPDTFSELTLTCGDRQMRPQPVTNNVFTWQRSHFTQPEDGPATITLTLAEGAGVYVDQLRVHRLTLDEPIKSLCTFQADSTLVSEERVACVIAAGDGGAYAAQAEAVAAAIEERGGGRPRIIPGDAVTEEQVRTTHVIALGDRESNFAIMRSSPDAWSHVPAPPEDGGPQIHVNVEPRGSGVNTIVLGGVDARQVRRSVAAFIARLQGEGTVVSEWQLLPEPELTDDREHYKNIAIASGKWLRRGAIRHLHRDWKYYADDTFIMLGYRYLEYLDSPDTIRQVPNDGFIDAETQKIVGNFNRREHHPTFAGPQGRLHRLQLTNLILHMARTCAGIFDWNCVRLPDGEKGHHPPAERTQILRQRPPMIAHNHQTFPTYAIATAADYFGTYYGLPEAQDWRRWAEMFMEGPLRSSKPMEDCWGYMDITMTHVARYAAISGRWDWFQQPMIYDFLTLRRMSHDNMGSGVGYGDVGAYRVPEGPVTAQSNASRGWQDACGGRLDLSRADYDDLLGVYAHPLEPMYYDHYAEGSIVLLEQAFDKITFRNEVDPQAAYLLLDGISGGYHGHWDGNSILRFTGNNRMWLCEGDYLKSEPRDHNTLTIMRDAEGALPGLLSGLEERIVSDRWGATITRTPGYNGADWDRHLIWHRPTDTFMLFDEVTAREPDAYDIKARFRSLGDTAIEERTWHVRQQGEHFFLHAPGDGALMEALDPEDTGNWASYEFVEDSTPKVLSHRVRRDLRPGERAVLPAVFYASSRQAPRQSVRRLSDDAIAIDGEPRLLAGVRALSAAGAEVTARQFALGPSDVLLIDVQSVTSDGRLIEAGAPMRLALALDDGTGVVEAAAQGTLSVLTGDGAPLTIDGQPGERGEDGLSTVTVTPGRHKLAGGFGELAQRLGEAWEGAWDAAETAPPPPEPTPTHDMVPAFEAQMPAEVTVLKSADLTGDGAPEFLVGCEDGTLVALDARGEELFRHRFDARVNDLDVGQLEVGGAPEIAAAVEDSHLHVLSASGEELWARFFEAYSASGGVNGHPRAVRIADFEGDGVSEIAVGAANSFFYVLDNRGELKGGDEPWETVWRHEGLAIGVADLTGDGLKELLCGYTYFSQRIIDFSRTGRSRLTVVRSAKGGTSVIAVADVDGDGLPESLWGDVDGRVTACTVSERDDMAADVTWTKQIGDDRVAALVPADLDDDGAPEIALASDSGFLALLGADGEVRWVRYADNQVTDAQVIGRAIARTSRDGSVTVYDAAGEELARWHVGEPLQILTVDGSRDRPLIVTAGGSTIRAGTWKR